MGKLRAGDLVEVRSREEILATLDGRGCLDALPFMPEMLKHCGKRFRVIKRAHKTCDTIEAKGARRLERTVHLEGLRCDGEFHGGCQAGCLLFWREAWLRRVGRADVGGRAAAGCMEQTLHEVASRQVEADPGSGKTETVYCCQATELNRASTAVPPRSVRHYIEDWTSGNVGLLRLARAFGFWLFTNLLRIGAYRLLIYLFDSAQRLFGGTPYPFKWGSCGAQTPAERLDLRPGEWVRVKPQEEILATVNETNRNRGLSFDEEMVPFCGGTYRVLRRVEKIIHERTGRMIRFKNDCIVLDGVTCQSRYKHLRLFCPRSIYPYWREIWLSRTDPLAESGQARSGPP